MVAPCCAYRSFVDTLHLRPQHGGYELFHPVAATRDRTVMLELPRTEGRIVGRAAEVMKFLSSVTIARTVTG